MSNERDTYYSRREKGEQANHHHTARFDVTDGFVGITQFEDDGPTVTGRVLLSPRQFQALVAFVRAPKASRLATIPRARRSPRLGG